MPFDGLRVLCLESRRAVEMATLIRNQKGEPVTAPSMREVPLEQNQLAFQFAEGLASGAFDMVILLTGVGTRYLDKVITSGEGPPLADGLRTVTVVARGPKPMAVLREWEVPAILVPEPNTWREILYTVRELPERNVAVQEYGRPSPDLVEGLIGQNRKVTTVPVYQWDLPEDTSPLRAAVHELAKGKIDVAMFTTSIQIEHLLLVAAQENLEAEVLSGLQKAVVASIGPTTSEALEEQGIEPDFEPSHPKMGNLVLECGQRAAELLSAKRGR
jgi:uroporphyrinogen-III synthase